MGLLGYALGNALEAGGNTASTVIQNQEKERAIELREQNLAQLRAQLENDNSAKASDRALAIVDATPSDAFMNKGLIDTVGGIKKQLADNLAGEQTKTAIAARQNAATANIENDYDTVPDTDPGDDDTSAYNTDIAKAKADNDATPEEAQKIGLIGSVTSNKNELALAKIEAANQRLTDKLDSAEKIAAAKDATTKAKMDGYMGVLDSKIALNNALAVKADAQAGFADRRGVTNLTAEIARTNAETKQLTALKDVTTARFNMSDKTPYDQMTTIQKADYDRLGAAIGASPGADTGYDLAALKAQATTNVKNAHGVKSFFGIAPNKDEIKAEVQRLKAGSNPTATGKKPPIDSFWNSN